MKKQSSPITFEERLSDIYNCKMQKSSTGLDLCVAKEPCRWSTSILNVKYCRDPSIPAIDISGCRVRVHSSGMAECITHEQSCKLNLVMGNIKTCLHPLTTNQIANRLEFGFGKIKRVRKDIAEIIINEGVELNERHVGELHDSLVFNYEAPVSILVNKINSYSYEFNALMKFGAIPEIGRIAVVARSKTAIYAASMLMTVPRENELKLKIFNDKTEALRWLM